MKNDEFDATRLESWATMLKALKDIAANRMPGVSDLLTQTAGAPAGKPGAQDTASTNPSDPGAKPNANPNQNPTTPQQPQAGQPQSTPPGGSKTVASITNGGTLPKGGAPPPPVDPKAPPKPAAPSITDNEPGFSKPPDAKPGDPKATPKAPGGGKLRLPVTTLGPAPDKGNQDDVPKPASPAQQTMQGAVKQQDDLLAEFAKVSDQLNQILTSLEASTFVKRFKAASKEQLKLATNIDQKTLNAFGIEDQPVQEAAPIAEQAKSQSEVVRVIQSDLDAYFARKQDARFKATLDEMKKTEIVQALAGDGDKVNVNLSGQAMTGSQYWADTLDRWAEEMVAASHCKACSSCSGDSLPPEIVLKVMQALRDEMKLRDSTREAENAKPAMDPQKYTEDAQGLGGTQADIDTHTAGAITDILALPDGESKFPKELGLLKQVVTVMDESHNTLEKPDTGPNAIGAETEAIELLLQSKRSGNKGGGGGGSNPGGGNGPASVSDAALADFGPAGDAQVVITARPVNQATGVAGQEYPDEFKAGLDAYFSLLEKPAAGK